MKKINCTKQKNFNKQAFLFAAAFPLFLGGCNTMEGAGTDIKHAGKALERSADRNKNSSPPCPCCSRHAPS